MSRQRAAVYARVSTIDKNQNPETQLKPLREYVDCRGFTLSHEYVDHASGKKDNLRTLVTDVTRSSSARTWYVLEQI